MLWISVDYIMFQIWLSTKILSILRVNSLLTSKFQQRLLLYGVYGVINLIADFEKRQNIFNFRPFKLEAFIVITRDALHVIRISHGHPLSYFSIYFGY